MHKSKTQNIKKIKKKQERDDRDLSYLSELIYEFADSHELEMPIETILEGKSYEKITLYSYESSMFSFWTL